MEISLGELAAVLGAELTGDPRVRVHGVAPLAAAGPGILGIAATAAAGLRGARAAALLTRDPRPAAEPGVPVLRVDDLDSALERLARLLPPAPLASGVHPTAVIADDAEVAADAAVGPFAVIGAGSRVGAGSEIGSHVVVGRGCRVGRGSVLHPHAVLYDGVRLGEGSVVQSGACMGADGFGFVFQEGGFRKVPQVGGVAAGDRLEAAPNSTLDRGSVGDTRLGSGFQLGALAHVGHNAVVGDGTRVGAQTAVAGSTTIGSGVRIGQQCAIVGHITIGDRVRLDDFSGITHDTAPDAEIAAVMGRPRREARRASRLLLRLPRIVKRILALERAVRGTPSAGTGE